MQLCCTIVMLSTLRLEHARPSVAGCGGERQQCHLHNWNGRRLWRVHHFRGEPLCHLFVPLWSCMAPSRFLKLPVCLQ